MSTVFGIVLFLILALWLFFEVRSLVKTIKLKRKNKKEKSKEKINNTEQEIIDKDEFDSD